MNPLGTGNIAADYIVTAVLWLAAVLQIAVLRDRSLPETRQSEAYRWLIFAGLLGLAVRFTFVLIDTGDLLVPVYSLIPVGLLALGAIGLGLEKFRRVPHTRRRDDLVTSDWPDISFPGGT
jgi:hypothetical protein